MNKIEVKDDYVKGFEDTCKKAGLDPKEVFVKNGQWAGKLMSSIGRAVSKPVAAVAQGVGAKQFGGNLARLNMLRDEAGSKINLRRFIEDVGFGQGGIKGVKGGELKITRKGPGGSYNVQYYAPRSVPGESNMWSKEIPEDMLPSDIRQHFKDPDNYNWAGAVEPRPMKNLRGAADTLAESPLYKTVGKYTTAIGTPIAGAAAIGMSGGKAKSPEPEYDLKGPKGYAMY